MKLLLIDGLNLVRRIYAAIPGIADAPINGANQTQIIQSCVNSLKRALKTHQPSHCVAVFESRGETWRHKILPDYKKNRSAVPELLTTTLPGIKSSFQEIGVESFELDGFEADDVIATFTCRIADNKGQSIILSTDRLHCQLLSDYIQVYDHFSDQYLGLDSVLKKYLTTPDRITQIMALAGNSGLSIPGVKSVGIKTAAKLIEEYGDLDTVLKSASIIPGALGKNLVKHVEDARLSFQIFTLKTDINLGVNLKQFRYIEK